VEGVWKSELTKNYGNDTKHLTADIEKRIMEWFGHVVRMNQTRVAMKFAWRKPGGRRKLWRREGQTDMVIRWRG
jgi:hypothetical protein